MSDLHQFNPGRKSWKMYSKELTSISGDDLTISPYDGQNLILEVSGNGNILFKEDGITYNLADLSNAASSSSNVNLTNYDDASFGNVDISGIINFFATDEQLLGPDTGIAQKVQDLSNSIGDLSNNLANLSINNIASLTGTDGSTSYDYIHVTTSQHVKSSWSYGSNLSITTARAGMLIDGGLFIHASDPQGNGSGTKSPFDSVSEQFATGGDVPLEADFMVAGTSHLIGNTYIGPNGNLILFGDIMGSSGQTILSSSGIVFESDLNVLNVGSDPKSYSSGISGEVLTSQGHSNPPIWVPLNEGGSYSAFTNVNNNFTVGQTIGGDSTINGLTIGRGSGGVDNNTAVGNNALEANAGGYYNVAVGTHALEATTTGGENTAIGAFASRNCSLGSYNTAIGSEALYNNTGHWNTAIGRHAMGGGTGGQYNVAIGPMALYSNSNFHNTAVGFAASNYNTTGGGNTAIGSGAMNNNTTGYYNTAVGHEAGYRISNGNNLTVAYESTFIGQDTRANADSETNQIVIGRGAIGNGSNTITLGNTNSNGLYVPGLQAGAATGDVLTFDGTKIALATPSAGGSTFTNLTATGTIFANTIDRIGNENIQRLGNINSAHITIEHNHPSHTYGSGSAGSWYGGFNGANLFAGSSSFRARSNQCQASHNLTITSDDRFKSRTVNLPDNCLDIINKLQPKKYLKHHGHYVPEGVEDSDLTGVEAINEAGLISQDVEKIPELNWLITEQELGIDTKKYFKAIDYGSLYPYLIKAVQELNECVKSLEAKVKTLESK